MPRVMYMLDLEGTQYLGGSSMARWRVLKMEKGSMMARKYGRTGTGFMIKCCNLYMVLSEQLPG